MQILGGSSEGLIIESLTSKYGTWIKFLAPSSGPGLAWLLWSFRVWTIGQSSLNDSQINSSNVKHIYNEGKDHELSDLNNWMNSRNINRQSRSTVLKNPKGFRFDIAGPVMHRTEKSNWKWRIIEDLTTEDSIITQGSEILFYPVYS